MVRGANRRVVEVSNVESEYFERAIFFVREEYDQEPEERLRCTAGEYIADAGVFRARHSRWRSILLGAAKLLGAAGVGAIVTLCVK